jgi:hypothetical protein
MNIVQELPVEPLFTLHGDCARMELAPTHMSEGLRTITPRGADVCPAVAGLFRDADRKPTHIVLSWALDGSNVASPVHEDAVCEHEPGAQGTDYDIALSDNTTVRVKWAKNREFCSAAASVAPAMGDGKRECGYLTAALSDRRLPGALRIIDTAAARLCQLWIQLP